MVAFAGRMFSTTGDDVMRVGQHAVIWHPLFKRPAVKKVSCEILAIGARIKVESSGSYNLLLPPEIIAVFDDKDTADAIAAELSAIGQNYFTAERNALQRQCAEILEIAKAASEAKP
jgi:hypothetical protein